MKWTEWLTLVLAVWGAALSSGLAWREIGSDRRRLKVRCSGAMASMPSGEVVEFLIVSAVNVGKRPVEVQSGGLLLSDGYQFTQVVSRLGPQPFRTRIADGESVEYRFDLDEIVKFALDPKRKGDFVKAFVRDAEGRTYPTGLSRELRKRLNRRRTSTPADVEESTSAADRSG